VKINATEFMRGQQDYQLGYPEPVKPTSESYARGFKAEEERQLFWFNEDYAKEQQDTARSIQNGH
jgi:hypothetical protein